MEIELDAAANQLIPRISQDDTLAAGRTSISSAPQAAEMEIELAAAAAAAATAADQFAANSSGEELSDGEDEGDDAVGFGFGDGGPLQDVKQEAAPGAVTGPMALPAAAPPAALLSVAAAKPPADAVLPAAGPFPARPRPVPGPSFTHAPNLQPGGQQLAGGEPAQCSAGAEAAKSSAGEEPATPPASPAHGLVAGNSLAAQAAALRAAARGGSLQRMLEAGRYVK